MVLSSYNELWQIAKYIYLKIWICVRCLRSQDFNQCVINYLDYWKTSQESWRKTKTLHQNPAAFIISEQISTDFRFKFLILRECWQLCGQTWIVCDYCLPVLFETMHAKCCKDIWRRSDGLQWWQQFFKVHSVSL